MIPAHGTHALLDGDALIYAVGFGSQDSPLRFAVQRLESLVSELVYMNAGCDTYEGFLTCSGPTYRHRLAVTAPYKGTRTSPRPVHYAALRHYAMEEMGWIMSEDCEADDLVGIRSTEMASDKPVMIHVDKDLDMLPGVHMNTKTREWFEVSPEEGLATFYRQMLIGDRTDNIVGAQGIGKQRAALLITPDMSEELMEVMVCQYLESEERLIENGRLLWMQTKPGELWLPPMSRGKDGQNR